LGFAARCFVAEGFAEPDCAAPELGGFVAGVTGVCATPGRATIDKPKRTVTTGPRHMADRGEKKPDMIPL
jgi:hypothetical protein